MAEFSESQAESLARICFNSHGFETDIIHLMHQFKDKDIGLESFEKKMRKLRRIATDVKTGVALSTGVLADQIIYSAMSYSVFGISVSKTNVEAHKFCIVSGNTASEPEERKPQVGDYYEVHTKGIGLFETGSVVQILRDESGENVLLKVISGSCGYYDADGKLGAWGRLNDMTYLPMYVESAVPVQNEPVTATELKEDAPEWYGVGVRRTGRFYPSTSIYLDEIKQPKETIMNASNIINTQTNVFGVNAAHLSDEEIFVQIGKVDAEIERLEKCSTKPKKLQKNIADLKEALDVLVKFVDSRD